ncbi:DUF1836 domain-containing protein [Planococcus halotolerans]|uniref:DUF1836 domain-containing protein n=1 Tax=Planococcus halotolerans TaxID=2233542 RepID=A0A365KR58_9BACL|nr:DUF1836 domain-containing protein [Planococcus halotolerans]QHJ69398.1 DUF1836 domain-containing protein [Planococcus halotolerans]RAZ75620.1 hypothetical protein DP120_12500 [Planococcus halotolerans]
MADAKELISRLALEKKIPVEEIPKIDLYIDQVIQLFDTGFSEMKRTPEDKILTKTMINNYAKGKLFYPVTNKKYSRNHVMLISLIYQMKSALSINDVKKVLAGINEKAAQKEIDLSEFYDSYLEIQRFNDEIFKRNVEQQVERAEAESADFGNDREEINKVLLIASLVHMSNLYRRAAETLVDEMAGGKEA